MYLISDDPTWLAGGLALAAVACFLALKTTQEGKYLIWGVAALAGAGLVVAVEWVWVTDDERIEYVVYDLRKALLAGDVDGVLARMTPEVQYVQEGQTLSGAATRLLIRTSMAGSRFETLRIHNLQTSVGRQTRRGKAEFKVFVQGNVQGPLGMGGAGAANTSWSLGFEEAKPKVWLVNRITPVSLPYNVAATINAPRVEPSETQRPFFGRRHPRTDAPEKAGRGRRMIPFNPPEPAR
ncbi:hypothetical protein [Paludisphaera borealis]|uniref:Uncharacterized protein n=1 Tax=Paludisphaera borealis TaxID=1387353 RepID=A0A1U7CS65_9BACT|nr:hypothetical protein [Paludisphaera borealis]APW61790.1 hypothetical protein BSF38_03319 [Paludisphaera borealis]MDR3619568.1 hypothetical protein [Paludisphaera borealis]